MVSVVLADKHGLVREAIRSLLEKATNVAVVAEANNGLQALTLVERLKPTVLITELSLPQMDGLQLTKQVSTGRNRTRVIVLSSYCNDEYVLQALANGAQAYIPKTANLSDLVQAVTAVCDGHRYLSPLCTNRGIETLLEQAQQGREDAYNTLSPREQQVFQLVGDCKIYCVNRSDADTVLKEND